MLHFSLLKSVLGGPVTCTSKHSELKIYDAIILIHDYQINVGSINNIWWPVMGGQGM